LVNVNDVAPEYRHLAGVEGHLRALKRIRALTNQAGIPFVLFAAYDINRDWRPVEAFIKDSGILWPHFNEVAGLRYQLSVQNRHYNVDGNRELARRVFEGLMSVGSVCTQITAPGAVSPSAPRTEQVPPAEVPGVPVNSPDTFVPPGRVTLGMEGAAATGPFAAFGAAGKAGTFSLTVAAAGTPCKDVDGTLYADLVATLDGKPLAVWPLTSDQLKPYASPPFVLSGARQEIQFSLAKDRYLGPSCDRNIRVEWAELTVAEEAR
jgi:hypothetical protein